jgi:hypothetical protein
MAFQRVRVFNQGLVQAPAANAWEWLTDWAGTRRARNAAAAGGAGTTGTLAFKGIQLVGGENDVPRTRVIDFPQLGEVRETVRGQCDETMHLYYTIDGNGPLGIRNYLATTDIDPVSDATCLVTITARFDLADGLDVVKAKGLIDNAHNHVVIGGLQRFFAAAP